MKIAIVMLTMLLTADGFKADAQSFEVLNPQVQQGGVLVIRIAPQWMPPAAFNPAIAVFGKHYLPNKNGEVFIGTPLDTEPGKYAVTLVEYGRGIQLSWGYKEAEIIKKSYPTRVRGPFIPTPKWRREQKVIVQAFDHGSYFERYFDGGFVKPLDEVIVDKDRTVGSESSPFGRGHNGVDLITLDPKTGRHQRRVKAINSGRVVLIARNFSTEGNMLIVDHGSGIFSVYMHLSKFLVKKTGDKVKKGEIIALSGETGSAKRRASCARCGPHLHLSVKIRSKDGKSNVYVDPLGFIDTVNRYLE